MMRHLLKVYALHCELLAVLSMPKMIPKIQMHSVAPRQSPIQSLSHGFYFYGIVVGLVIIFGFSNTCLFAGLDFFGSGNNVYSSEPPVVAEFAIGFIPYPPGKLLPVTLRFQPSSQSTHSILGQGWTCPLVDSNAFYENENSLVVALPDSNRLRFSRNGAGQFFDPSGEWRIDIGTDILTLASSDGTTLKFKNGKISSFKTSGSTIDINQHGTTDIDLKINGASSFSLLKKSNDAVVGRINGKEVNISLCEVPVLKQIGNTLIVDRTQSVPQIVSVNDRLVQKLSYSLDDVSSGIIRCAGQGAVTFSVFWKAGERSLPTPTMDVKQLSDNSTFKSGACSNRPRWVRDGNTVTRFSYDEAGKLCRVSNQNYTFSKTNGGFLIKFLDGRRLEYNFAGDFINDSMESTSINKNNKIGEL